LALPLMEGMAAARGDVGVERGRHLVGRAECINGRLADQAGVTSKLAQDDRMLELAAESGCTMLSIGFESISRSTLKSVHKHVNRPETFAALVEKVHSYGIIVFGLFMFGFDGDDLSVFEETARFNRESDYDACAYSVLMPYPGTLPWYEMRRANRIVSFDWEKYDQATSSITRPKCPATSSGSAMRRPFGISIRCCRSRAGFRSAAGNIVPNG
jgi:radical SAM superfamily enzyme YgiQ (UPF0313 family)